MPDYSFWPDSDVFHLDLPERVSKLFDEFDHHKSDSHFCAFTINELKQGRFNA